MCQYVAGGLAGARETVPADRIVVTATKTETRVADVPASVEIVTREDIRRMEGSTVTDVLKFATGINFSSNMMRTTPSIRGMEGRHTLLLVDGKRMAGPQGKFNETDRMTLENVERIEIIRGPMSTLYGSEAMGGVINVITKKPEAVSATAGMKYGAYDRDADFTEAYFDLTLAGEKMGRFGLNLSGQLIDANAVVTGENETHSPDKELRSVSGKLTCQFSEALSSTLTLGYTDDEVKNRNLSTYLRSSDNEYERFDSSLELEYKTPELTALIRGYHSDYEKEYETRYLEDYTSRGTLHTEGELKDFDSSERKTTVVEGQVSKLVADSHLVTMGGEWRREFHHSARMDTGEGNFTLTREGLTVKGSEAEPDNYALFLQDEWSIGDKILIIPGVRYDDPEEFDSEVSPKLGVTWFMRPDLRLKVNYGHSYVAPSAPQLYKDWYGMGGKYHIIGNKDLKPEVSDSYEIALEGEKGRFNGRIAYFYNDVSDLIDSEFSHKEDARTKVYVYRNIGKAEIQGAELEAGFRITDNLSFNASYAYLDAMDKDTDERLDKRAKNKIVAKLYYTNPRYGFDLNLWGEHTLDYLEKEKNYDFTIVNLNVKKRLNDKVDIYVGADNLLDEKETELHDKLLGTMVYAGVNVRFYR
ncbi:MAG: TonB-dependent receptor [Desulfobacteraceae bacterium]|nr:TonB-dependent receptor [Desulfobacteraceae bacterium]